MWFLRKTYIDPPRNVNKTRLPNKISGGRKWRVKEEEEKKRREGEEL